MKDIIFNIRYWFQHKITSNIRSVYDGICNIFSYMPIIYRDRDWDHSFFNDLLQFKLQKMYKHFSTVDSLKIESNQKVAAQIKICLDILYKLDNEDSYYVHPEHQEYLIKSLINGGFDMSKYDISKWIEYEETAKNNDIEKLYSTIAKHYREWWD